MQAASMSILVETIPCKPGFDMELLASLSQEPCLDRTHMAFCMERWNAWINTLCVSRIAVGACSYALVCLDDVVEKEVDRAWSARPSEGFLLNALAQALVMAAMHEILPEVREFGCAPVPEPTPELRQGLLSTKVPYAGKGSALSRRYAVLTRYPFRGGCSHCALFGDCPRKKTGASSVN